MFRNKVNSHESTPAERKARVEGLLQKEKERRDRLKELEIDYTFPGFSALVAQAKTKPAVAAVEPKTKAIKKSGKK